MGCFNLCFIPVISSIFISPCGTLLPYTDSDIRGWKGLLDKGHVVTYCDSFHQTYHLLDAKRNAFKKTSNCILTHNNDSKNMSQIIVWFWQAHDQYKIHLVIWYTNKRFKKYVYNSSWVYSVTVNCWNTPIWLYTLRGYIMSRFTCFPFYSLPLFLKNIPSVVPRETSLW